MNTDKNELRSCEEIARECVYASKPWDKDIASCWGISTQIKKIEEALSWERARTDEAQNELAKLRKIAEQCINDDEENSLSIDLNIAGKWMLEFLNGGNFPT